MRVAGLALLALLAACKSEPDFDERYDRAEKAIASKAASIDSELANEDARGSPSVSGR